MGPLRGGWRHPGAWVPGGQWGVRCRAGFFACLRPPRLELWGRAGWGEAGCLGP